MWGPCGSCADHLIEGENQAYFMGRRNDFRGSLGLTSSRSIPHPFSGLGDALIATTLLLNSGDGTILSCIWWTLDPI